MSLAEAIAVVVVLLASIAAYGFIYAVETLSQADLLDDIHPHAPRQPETP